MIPAFALSLVSIQLALHAAESYKPKHINKAVELLEQGQPVYYTTTSGGGYEEGSQGGRLALLQELALRR
jgi:hypothetical protein